MESELKKLIEIQELILDRLNQSTFLTKEPIANIKTSTKKEENDRKIQEYK